MEKIDYIRKLYTRESEQQKQIREHHQDQPINIEPEIGQTIVLLLKLMNAKKIVEIGTLSGYSTSWFLRGLPEDGQIVTIEKDVIRHERAMPFLKDARIRSILGDARKMLPTLKGPFDVVFIDAAKLHYLTYLDWAEKNLRPGGLLIADDTFLFGHVFDAPYCDHPVRPTTLDVMKTFNERLSKAPWESIILPFGDGLSIACLCKERSDVAIQ